LVAHPFHRGLGEPSLISRVGVALNFTERLVATDGGKLMHGTSGIGQPGQRRLAQPVKDAVLRQVGGVAPRPEYLREIVCAVALAGLSHHARELLH